MSKTSFVVTITLTEEELEFLATGEFRKIRKEFFTSPEFCNYVLQNYPINKDFIQFALPNINELNLKDIFNQYNLLEYPEDLGLNKFSPALFYFEIQDYKFIHPIHWEKYFDSILEFFGSTKTMLLSNLSNAKLDKQVRKQFATEHIPASTFCMLANLERFFYTENQDDNLENLNNLLNSSEYAKYWDMSDFIPGACYILEKNLVQEVALEKLKLPLKAEKADIVLKYCQQPTANLAWGLSLYLKIRNSDCSISEEVFSKVFPYHPLNYTELVSAYRTGTYHISKNLVAITDSMNEFEKLLEEINPEGLRELNKRIFEDIERNPHSWNNYSFFNSFYVQSKLQRKIAEYIR